VIRGADASLFSHSQLANDVKALPVGHWQWNALLQIQGRVLALLLLIKLGEDEILLVLPRDILDEVRNTLSRYVLRSRVRIQAEDRLQVLGHWSRCSDIHRALATGGPIGHRTDGFELELGGQSHRRLLCVSAETPPAAGSASAPHAGDQWRADDIADGIPWVRAETQAEFIPQALGLGRLSAYSVAKGCYPGQEIVARTHFLGRNKRTLKGLIGDAGGFVPRAGSRLVGSSDGSGDAVGIVVDCIRAADGGTQGLCVVRDPDIADVWCIGPNGVGHYAAIDVASSASENAPQLRPPAE
jgi:folate-binding protein YgfZ